MRQKSLSNHEIGTMKEKDRLTSTELAEITQHSEENLALVNDEQVTRPEFQGNQQTPTPFINLLPIELEIQILLKLPFESWRSLYETSIHWRAVVVSAAIPFFNSVEVKDKLETLLGFDFKTLTDDLKLKTDLLMEPGGRQPLMASLLRAPKHLLNELVENLSLLKNPLAKLKLLYKRLNEISPITDSVSISLSIYYSLSLFAPLHPSIASKSRVVRLTTEFLNKAPLNWMNEPWLQTIYQFLAFFPEHPLAKELDSTAIAQGATTSDSAPLISDNERVEEGHYELLSRQTL